MRFIVGCLILVCSCKNKLIPSVLPLEIREKCLDSLLLNTDDSTHIGKVQIEDSLLIAQTFDKQSRNNARLSLFNLNSKEWRGNFDWPVVNDGIYWGVAAEDKYLLYFTNFNYLIRIDRERKIRDSISLLQSPDEMIDMVIARHKLYSLNNIYGINIVDLSNTARQITKRNFKGSFYLEQNSISTPVDSLLNLVMSCQVSDSQYVVYAIDEKMEVKWEKTLLIKNRFVQIRAINVGDYFLIKYEDRIALLSKVDGAVVWQKQFDYYVYNVTRLNREEILIYLSSNDNADNASDSLANRSIIKMNLTNKHIDWEKEGIGWGGKLGFIAQSCLFEYNDKRRWVWIDLNSGDYSFVDLPASATRIDIIKDKITGKGYLLFGDKLFW